jgi:AcrR family transcriptional regulator
MTLHRSVCYCWRMSIKTNNRPPARERLLEAAGELFYQEGVHTVGIDRVIARSGVAKATLYTSFGSKEELIRAYLTERHSQWERRIEQKLAEGYDTPREKLLAVFDVLGEWYAEPGFRGCAMVNASAEAQPGSPVEQASDEGRAWVRNLFAKLATEAGADDPEQLIILYDGSTVAARMDRNPEAAAIARSVAEITVGAAIKPPKRRARQAKS